MREIKFRGKTKSGEWLYGLPTFNFLYIFNETQLNSVDNYSFVRETLGQFTGFLDKNRKEIYENDIIKYYGKILLVMVDVYYGISLKTINEPFKTSFDFDSASIIKCENEIEVIGNIYENPEILQ